MIILIASIIAMLMSLYYWYFGDLYLNMQEWVLFDTTRWITPCEMCRYIRIAQYPIVFISMTALLKKEYVSSKLNILLLSVLWIIFSGYKLLLEQGILSSSGWWLCWMDASVSCGKATYLLGTGISLAASWLILFVMILWLLLLEKKN